jgi:beta-lactamase regulating signal transducer with metallopeptidase domain
VFWWVVHNTLTAAVLAAAVALVVRIGRPSPAVRHALWLIVLVKLLLPPLVNWPWSFFDLRGNLLALVWPQRETQVDGLPTAPDERLLAEQADENARLAAAARDALLSYGKQPAREPPKTLVATAAGIGTDAATAQLASPLSEEASDALPAAPLQPETAGPSLIWERACQLALYGWLAGTAALIVLQVVRIRRFQALLARARPPSLELTQLIARMVQRLGVRPVRCLVVPGIVSPALWCLGRPVLVWPADLPDRLPSRSWPSVIAHELAHLRRRDQWVSRLLLAAECCWWWNPVFWFVRRQVLVQAELACDAWVVEVLPEDRRPYAEALLEVSLWQSWAAAPLPALGMGHGPRKTFERRLTMIMCDRVPCRVSLGALAAIALLSLAILPGWSQDRQPERPKKDTVAQAPAAPAAPAPSRDAVKRALGVAVADLDGDGFADVLVFGDAAPVDARDKQLQDLEAKLQGLLKEVQALRSGNKPPAASKEVPARAKILLRTPGDGTFQDVTGAAGIVQRRAVARVTTDANDKAVNLIRTTYKLPKTKAEALAALLKDNAKVAVLETKVDADTLTITTTPEAQHAIGHFIDFLEGKVTSGGLGYKILYDTLDPVPRPAVGAQEVPSKR